MCRATSIRVESEPAVAESEIVQRDEVMAIDFSRGRDDDAFQVGSVVAEGADILGLIGDDDIGEKFLSIKRVKPLAVTGRANDPDAVQVEQASAQSEKPEEIVLTLVGSEISEPEIDSATIDHTMQADHQFDRSPCAYSGCESWR